MNLARFKRKKTTISLKVFKTVVIEGSLTDVNTEVRFLKVHVKDWMWTCSECYFIKKQIKPIDTQPSMYTYIHLSDAVLVHSLHTFHEWTSTALIPLIVFCQNYFWKHYQTNKAVQRTAISTANASMHKLVIARTRACVLWPFHVLCDLDLWAMDWGQGHCTLSQWWHLLY